MFSYGHRSIDPNDLEAKISTEEGVCWLDFLVDDDMSEEKQEQLERIQTLLDDLPPMEADYVDLYYYHRKKQTDIASMFGVSQPTVCYRLQRAAARIQFLLSLPPIDDAEVEATMREFLTDEIDVRIMVQMLKTTCQSEVAKRLDVSQGLVRHRFIRAIGLMRDAKMYHEGYRYKVYQPTTDTWEYTKLLKEARLMASDGDDPSLEISEPLKEGKRGGGKSSPKIVEIPQMHSQIGKFYDIYHAISANLNILRDVRRKGPEQDVQLIVW